MGTMWSCAPHYSSQVRKPFTAQCHQIDWYGTKHLHSCVISTHMKQNMCTHTCSHWENFCVAVFLESELTALEVGLSWIGSKHLNRRERPASVAPYPTQQLCAHVVGQLHSQVSSLRSFPRWSCTYTRRSNDSHVMPNATSPFM